MQIFELRFPVKRDKWRTDGIYTGKFITLLDLFINELARNGLILEGGAHSFERDGMPVSRVIAQDDKAIEEHQMGYDTKKALAALIKLCDGLPQVIPCEECFDIPHCTCKKPSSLVLQAAPEWAGSPVRCCDCHKSVPLYKVTRSAADREFDDLLHWRQIYRGYIGQYKSGLNAAYAYDMIRNCVSDFSLLGRRLAGLVETSTGTITFYQLFCDNERVPDVCPQCGAPWRNPYRDAIPYDFFCRGCRLVM